MTKPTLTSDVMRLAEARPSRLARTLGTELDQLLGELGLRSRLPFAWFESDPGTGPWSPTIEVQEKGSDFFVRAELPGLDKDDVVVNVTDDAVVLEGERKQESVKEDHGYYRTERRYGQFRRVIALPEGADPNSAVATFKDGILEVGVHVNVKETPQMRRLSIG